MNNVFYIGFLFLTLGLISDAISQSTTFTADPGRWTEVANWSNGLPNSTTNAIIDGRCRTPFGAGDCLNLEILAGRILRLSAGNSITVNGKFNMESTASLINEGTLSFRGNIFIDGATRLEVSSSVQFSSNFNIGQ